METAPRICRFLSLVVVERVLKFRELLFCNFLTFFKKTRRCEKGWRESAEMRILRPFHPTEVPGHPTANFSPRPHPPKIYNLGCVFRGRTCPDRRAHLGPSGPKSRKSPQMGSRCRERGSRKKVEKESKNPKDPAVLKILRRINSLSPY